MENRHRPTGDPAPTTQRNTLGAWRRRGLVGSKALAGQHRKGNCHAESDFLVGLTNDHGSAACRAAAGRRSRPVFATDRRTFGRGGRARGRHGSPRRTNRAETISETADAWKSSGRSAPTARRRRPARGVPRRSDHSRHRTVSGRRGRCTCHGPVYLAKRRADPDSAVRAIYDHGRIPAEPPFAGGRDRQSGARSDFPRGPGDSPRRFSSRLARYRPAPLAALARFSAMASRYFRRVSRSRGDCRSQRISGIPSAVTSDRPLAAKRRSQQRSHRNSSGRAIAAQTSSASIGAGMIR